MFLQPAQQASRWAPAHLEQLVQPVPHWEPRWGPERLGLLWAQRVVASPSAPRSFAHILRLRLPSPESELSTHLLLS